MTNPDAKFCGGCGSPLNLKSSHKIEVNTDLNISSNTVAAKNSGRKSKIIKIAAGCFLFIFFIYYMNIFFSQENFDNDLYFSDNFTTEVISLDNNESTVSVTNNSTYDYKSVNVFIYPSEIDEAEEPRNSKYKQRLNDQDILKLKSNETKLIKIVLPPGEYYYQNPSISASTQHVHLETSYSDLIIAVLLFLLAIIINLSLIKDFISHLKKKNKIFIGSILLLVCLIYFVPVCISQLSNDGIDIVAYKKNAIPTSFENISQGNHKAGDKIVFRSSLEPYKFITTTKYDDFFIIGNSITNDNYQESKAIIRYIWDKKRILPFERLDDYILWGEISDTKVIGEQIPVIDIYDIEQFADQPIIDKLKKADNGYTFWDNPYDETK